MFFIRQKRYRVIMIHVLAWTIHVFLGTVRQLFDPGETLNINLLDLVITELPCVYIFYMHYWILVKFLSTRKYLLLFFAEIALFLSCDGIYYITGYIIAPLINKGEAVPAFNFVRHSVYTLWLYSIYGFFSFGYYFGTQAVKKEKQLGVMQLEKLKIEQDRLQAEYAFLRAQINPHFLHNTLNFFYAKSLGYSQELSDGILTLCEIMRYSLNSGEDEQGTVWLGKEIEHLQNVIKINQLRFSNRLQVELSITGDLTNIRIIPLVLITLVENCLKHGELTNKEHPVIIKLEADAGQQRILFSTYNRKKKGPKELSHGIGMDNIRKRLYAAYKDQYTLNIKDEADAYTAALVIRLNTDAATALSVAPENAVIPKLVM